MNRLLIAEDEKLIRQGLSAMIRRAPVEIREIVECRNGEEAFEYMKTAPVDVLFTDVRMPRMDGLTLIRKVREELEIPWPKPEIVIVSGHDDFNYAVSAMRYGSREYILKPVKRERVFELLARLDVLVSEQREEAEKREYFDRIGRRQLRYALAAPGFSGEELSSLGNTLGDLFQSGAYVVLCYNHGVEIPAEEAALKLENVGVFQIAAVPENLAASFIERYLGGAHVGASRSFRDFSDVRAAFEEAADARKYAFFTGSPVVNVGAFVYREEDFLPQRPPVQLARRIGSKEFSELVHLLNSLFTQAARGRLYPHIFEEFILGLLDCVTETFRSFIDGDGLAPLRDIYGYDTVDDYRLAMLQWLERLHTRVYSEIETSKSNERIAEAVEFVRQNYGRNMNMAVISNRVSMNYSVFSRMFKEYTGVCFVDYLRDLRLRNAVELLVNTDMKISEISGSIGFESDKYFMKSFKSVYGASPTQYRKTEQIRIHGKLL